MKKIFSLLLISAALVSCNREEPSAKNAAAAAVHPVIKELQHKYAPDHRTAIFTVSLDTEGDVVLVKGEVDNEQAKSELLSKLRSEYKNLSDSVIVLPAEELGDKTWGIITVSVANMRSEPREAAELSSQVLMGNIVRIWKKKKGFFYIQSPDKYLGWADANQLQRVTEHDALEWNKANKIFVTTLYDMVREEPSEKSFPVCDIVGGGVLKSAGSAKGWTKVELPDGRTGFLPLSSVINYNNWGAQLHPVAENIERTGKFLMGVPYLWGGTSIKGVDCSGFTKTVFLLNGMSLTRDASQQAEEGIEVDPGKDFENVKKGDLLFFGRKAEEGKPERIVHVGIYLEDKKYIHSSGKVHISSFDPQSSLFNKFNLERFVRVRRVIPSTPQVAEVKAH